MTADAVARTLLEDRLRFTGYIRALVIDNHAAEDIFQDTCVKAIARAETFETEKDALTWSRTVARNQSIDLIRSRQRKDYFLSEETLALLAEQEPQEAPRGSVDQLRALEACLKQLTPKTREVIRLRYGQNLAGAEVAIRLQRKAATVYKTLARAYSQLRNCMEHRLNSGL